MLDLGATYWRRQERIFHYEGGMRKEGHRNAFQLVFFMLKAYNIKKYM